ncbi:MULTISPECIES: YoaK family protein [unclassified Variovorax]|uniref:YoaK family protein n=1 Tax=unclassified Variovorax TaxID=663243 RepID=UPI003ED05D56
MRANILQALIQLVRTQRTNRQLGGALAFIAGAINAGGLLAVQRYTSNTTGIVSAIAGDLISGHVAWALAGVALLISFICGVATTAALVTRARRRRLQGEFAHPLVLEAVLLLLFGLLGANLELLGEWFVPSTVLLLCFIMGRQNAIVSKISKTEIRTTHMTGVITDLGVGLGRWIHGDDPRGVDGQRMVKADSEKVALYTTILGLFVGGGVVGAIAFSVVGSAAAVLFAAVLVTLAAPPVRQDLRSMGDRSTGDVS